MRSKSSANPKEGGPACVAIHTAESGPEGCKLRHKYMVAPVVKGTRSKASGNSGNTGRSFRRYQRHGGPGQVPTEEKARRSAQSAAALASRGQ